jgi:hypothetical protein
MTSYAMQQSFASFGLPPVCCELQHVHIAWISGDGGKQYLRETLAWMRSSVINNSKIRPSLPEILPFAIRTLR